jgi:hypothetical protein
MSRTASLPLLFGFALALVAAAPADANTTMHRYLVLDRTDYVAVGAGGVSAPVALGGGAGTLTVAGVSGTVTLALLYWNGIDVEMPEIGLTGGDADYDEPNVEFEGTAVTGTRVAHHGSNDCWPTDPPLPPSAALYRADVTAFVAARGNGDYTFAGMADKPGHSVNGVSLIVYFDDGNPANDLRISQYEGMQSNTEGVTFEFTVDYAGGVVDAILHVSDGQSLLPDGPFYWEAPGPIPDLAHNQIRYDHLYDGQPPWAGESVPQLGHPRNDTAPGLWDIQHMPLTALYGPPKSYPTEVHYNLTNDCVSLHVVQIVQPADPQPSMLSPNPFDFGDVVIGTQSATQRFTLTNLLPDPIDVDEPQIGVSQYVIVDETCGGATVAPGDSCWIDVAYSAFYDISAFDVPLVVSFNDPIHQGASIRAFAMMRAGGVPAGPYSRVEFDKHECAYPDKPMHESTGTVHYVATNTGTLPVTITRSGSFTPDYVAYNNGCAVDAVMAPGATCAVDVAFVPQSTARRNGSLGVEFTAADSDDHSAAVDLSGTGLEIGDAIQADGFDPVICSPW